MNDINSNKLKRENKLLRKQIMEVQNRYETKIAELSIIRELGMSLLYVPDFQRLFKHTLDVLINNTVAQNCSIMLLDEEENQLFLLCATNYKNDSYIVDPKNIFSKEDVLYSFKPGEGISGRALLEKKPILVKSAEESKIFAKKTETPLSINSLLSVPLIIYDKAIGVLNLSHSDDNVFNTEDIYLFSAIADFLTISISSSINYEKLQYSEENYRVLSEYSNNGIAIIQDNIHYYANPKYVELTGYDIDELKGMTFESLIKKSYSEKNLLKILANLKKGSNNEVFNVQMRRKDGTIIDTEISASSVLYNGKQTLLLSMLDITDRKLLEKQLIHAQKMQSMGTLAGGIAHNFNNLLMGIQGNASIALVDMNSDNPYYKNLLNIERLVKNGSNLTTQLLGYAREGKYEIKPLNLNKIIKETAETFGAARKDIKVNLDLTNKIYGVKADQGQLEQTFLNLYVNAADAMPGGGELFLKTANVTKENMNNKPYDPKPGNYVYISIRDTGVGMDKNTMERVFEPFFTTKGLAKGTGLGLASAYGIIKGHGGYIDVDSTKGEGAAFNIYLPATHEMITNEKEVSDEIFTGTGTILLIDDEEIVIYAGEQMLRKLGYSVIVANNGNEALEIYERDHNRIDLVLLDMVMPGMGGKETYTKLKEINSDVKVLLSSGYSLDGQATSIMEQGCDGFIQKPFNMKTLSQKVKEIITSD
jgi:two-component system cell cycle sensor histidine kinase/response regulator CckA